MSICYWCQQHQWCTLSCEYLRKFFWKNLKRPLWYINSGAWEKLIHEKNQKSKISWHCPFKEKHINYKRWHWPTLLLLIILCPKQLFHTQWKKDGFYDLIYYKEKYWIASKHKTNNCGFLRHFSLTTMHPRVFKTLHVLYNISQIVNHLYHTFYCLFLGSQIVFLAKQTLHNTSELKIKTCFFAWIKTNSRFEKAHWAIFHM